MSDLLCMQIVNLVMDSNLLAIQSILQTVAHQHPVFLQVIVTEVKYIEALSLFRLDFRAAGDGYPKEQVQSIFDDIANLLKEQSSALDIQEEFGALVSLVSQTEAQECSSIDSVYPTVTWRSPTPDESNGISISAWLTGSDAVPIYLEEMSRYLSLMMPNLTVEFCVQSFVNSSLTHHATFTQTQEDRLDDNSLTHSIDTEDFSMRISLLQSDDDVVQTTVTVRIAAVSVLQFNSQETYDFIRTVFDKANLPQFGIVIYEAAVLPLSTVFTTSFACGLITEAEILIDFKQPAGPKAVTACIVRLFTELSCQAPSLFFYNPQQFINSTLTNSIVESVCTILTASSNPEFISTALDITKSTSIPDLADALTNILTEQLHP